jgi:C-methyltransferase C-terminal domain/Putative zinc binding domain/Methyltransferase domain
VTRGLPARRRVGDRPRPVRCQICKTITVPGLDLGQQPVSDLILSRAQLNRPETFYPMQLHHCPDCGLTQLGHIVNPKVVYRDFPFVSGTTRTATQHLQALAQRLVDVTPLAKDSFAVDIGSNDGTLLKGYVPHGVRFLGIDPAGDPVTIANEQGVPTLHAFFNEESATQIRAEHGTADAISAAGVFGHIADLDGVMRGVQTLLAPEGVFLTENQYWLDMVERLHYDNMFHQHLRYYSVKPLLRLYDEYGLDVFDVSRSDIHGGSITVLGCRKGTRPISERVRELLAVEEAEGLYDEATWRRFAEAVEQRRRDLFDAVYSRAARGEKIVGIGAPAKAATVCNYCRLGPDLVAYVTEVNPLRIGKFLPGVHIPIVDEELLFTDPRPADVGILFAWNYYDEIVPKLRERGFSGELLQP